MKRGRKRLIALLAAVSILMTSFWSSGWVSAAEEETEPAVVQTESSAPVETTAAAGAGESSEPGEAAAEKNENGTEPIVTQTESSTAVETAAPESEKDGELTETPTEAAAATENDAETEKPTSDPSGPRKAPAAPVAEEEAGEPEAQAETMGDEWDFSFKLTRSDNTSKVKDLLDGDFDYYQYELRNDPNSGDRPAFPMTEERGKAELGPLEPSGKDVDQYGNVVLGGGQNPNMFLHLVTNKGYSQAIATLTYTTKTYTDFYAEYEMVPSRNMMGLVFGGAEGVFPVSKDGNSSNDTGVAIVMQAGGNLGIIGAINPDSVSLPDGVTKSTKGEMDGANYIYTSNIANRTISQQSSIDTDDDTTIAEKYAYTVCVEVDGNVLTVWEKQTPDCKISVRLTGQYEGGCVSLFANENNNGAFRSFAIKGIIHTCTVLDKVEATDATCTADGSSAYYVCTCGKLYSDETASSEITWDEIAIPANGHSWGDWTNDAANHSRICTKCSDKETEPHTPGALATGNAAQPCTVCGYEMFTTNGAIIAGTFHNIDVQALDQSFTAYCVANDGTKTKGKPSELWNCAKSATLTDGSSTSFSEAYLRAGHNSNENKDTYLSYEQENLTDFEASVKISNNWINYDIVIAPQGEAYKAGSGLKVHVDSGGTINVGGAIDIHNVKTTGSGTAASNMAGTEMNLKNALAGFGSRFPVNSSSLYTLHVRVEDGFVTVWVEEYPDETMIIALTEAYEGGIFSLYSTGGNQGGFGSLSLTKLIHECKAEKLTEIAAKPATCTDDGNSLYYICTCGKLYSDATAKVETTLEAVTTPANGHTYDAMAWTADENGHSNTCTVCQAQTTAEPHTPGAPATGDIAQTCTVCGYEILAALGDSATVSGIFHNADKAALDSAFTAYRFTGDGGQTKGSPSVFWNCAKSFTLSGETDARTFSEAYLRPGHKSDGQTTYLSYEKETLKDFEASVTIANNWTQYGLAVAPQGKTYSAGNGLAVFVNSDGHIYVQGAIDNSQVTVTGTGASYEITNAGQVLVKGITGMPTPNNGASANTLYTLCVKEENNTLTAWVQEYPDVKVTVAVTESYLGGVFSLYSTGCNQGGFERFTVTKLSDMEVDLTEPDPVDVTLFQNLTDIDVTDLEAAFAAYRFPADGKSREVGVPADFWNCGKQIPLPDSTTVDFGTAYLRPDHKANANQSAYLTWKQEGMKDFEASVKFANNYTQYGLVVAPMGEPYSAVSGVSVFVDSNGQIFVQGAIDSSRVTVTGNNATYKTTNTNAVVVSGISGMKAPDNGKCADTVYTLRVKVENGYVTAWVKEFPSVTVTVALTENYRGGFFSLYSTGCNQGGFQEFWLNKLSDMDPDRSQETSEDVTVYRDFNRLSSVWQLDDTFTAWYFASPEAQGVRGLASDYWNKSTQLEGQEGKYRNQALKPNHKASAPFQYTLLSYEAETVTDFEARISFLPNYTEYGLMVAPAGQLFGPETGIMAYVSSDGEIFLKGAIDAGTAVLSKGHIKVDTDSVGSGKIEGMIKPSDDTVLNQTEYTLHLKVADGVATAYIEEFPEVVLSANVGPYYQGGVFSLYSTGFNQGGFAGFSLKKLEETAPAPQPANVYARSFTTLRDVTELLDDFDVYTLDSIGEDMQTADIAEVFQLEKGRLQSNLAASGSDIGGFGILTLKDRRYENFELELTYEQGYLRYGVMIGTEPGEFAFTGEDGAIRGRTGGLLLYTEAEGYRNARGALTAESCDNAALALARRMVPEAAARAVSALSVTPEYTGAASEPPLLASFCDLGSVSDNLRQRVVHKMVIRVVGDCVTMVIDGDEDSRMTLRMDGYTGGYISLVTNARDDKEGAFEYLKITELPADASLGVPEPPRKEGFSSMTEIAKEFDAWYLADAAVSTQMEKVDVKTHWWLNKEGFLARDKQKSGSEFKDVDVLTWKKQSYTDFELTFTYQQNYGRTGIIIGTQEGQYPLRSTDKGLEAVGGLLLFVEAEGCVNAMGDFTNGYTNESQVRQRLDQPELEGFVDENKKADANVTAKKEHQVKIVVKNRELFVFVDGASDYTMYLTLPESYQGGYISLFSSMNREFGIDHFQISETITTPIPEGTGIQRDGNNMRVVFDKQKRDLTGFDLWYLEELDAQGSMKKIDFYDYWMVANGSLTRKSNRVAGSDVKDVAVLTYSERTYEDFVATFEYEKTPGRLMLLFGTENGSYPLYEKNGNFENGGVILYPENDLGAPGGICAIGDVKLATTQYRPLYRELPYAPGYHYLKDNGQPNVGDRHVMTVAVVNRHCFVYLDEYGLISTFDLTDDYEGGYISLASTQTNQHGFVSLSIEEIASTANVVVDVEQKRDITVRTGTALADLNLPGSVRVTMRDGSRLDVGVEWKDCGYQADETGEYRFVGTLQMPEGISNAALVSPVLTVRVRDSIRSNTGSTRMWTFDTMDDLADFTSYYVEDATQGGAVRSDFPMWYVAEGQLRMDRNRTGNGGERGNLHILTYTGQTYRNFELEVDFSQEYAREMVLFGSQKPGQYIDYADPHSSDNPIAAFVEFEGRRNAIGNVVNTNFYARTDEDVPFLHEDAAENPKYYDQNKPENSMGTMHTMRIRVVGDTISMYLDDQEEVFEGKLAEGYEGGYISLVSAVRTVQFDNLRITELDEEGNPLADNREVAADGTLNLELKAGAHSQDSEMVSGENEVLPTAAAESEGSGDAAILWKALGAAAVAFTVGIGALLLQKKGKKKKAKTGEPTKKQEEIPDETEG